MKKRLLTSSLIILATALAIVAKLLPHNIGDYIFDLFVLGICLLAGFEISLLMEKMGSKLNKLFATFYGILYYVVFLLCKKTVSFSVILAIELGVLVVYFVVVMIIELIKNKGKNIKKSAIVGLNTTIAALYPTFWFALLININHIDYFAGVKYFSLVFIVLIFAISMLTDTFAYIFGSLIKGPKLAPTISPKKTISGAVAGVIGGIFGAMLVYLLAKYNPHLTAIVNMYNLTWWQFVIFGVAGSIVGQIGDLFESRLKRNANVKDSGKLLPGHGGMLDRIDAQIFVTVFVYFIVVIILI